ncbi:MAG TPA: carboxylesterase family protein [Rhizomicrobium sp.]|jgi:para-nitrobenzyl esterase
MIRKQILAILAASILALGAATTVDALSMHPGRMPFGTVPDAGLFQKPTVKADSCALMLPVNGAQMCGVQTAPGFVAFRGIRYATAARWQPPVAAAVAANTTAFGSECPQPHYSGPQQSTIVDGKEDCLFLNVWTPNPVPTAKLPVMVFIHGGAFVSGSGSSPLYDGTALASQGVIVVTLNYRLGALGFLAAKKAALFPIEHGSQGMDVSGNFGLLDQQAALQWVQANIGYFGGDKTQVTIFGESAGAMSVGLQTMVMPSNYSQPSPGTYQPKYFRAAIMESNPLGQQYLSNSTAGDGANYVGDQFLGYLCETSQYNKPIDKKPNCSATADWASDPQKMNYQKIVMAQNGFLKKAILEKDVLRAVIGIRELPWQPVMDGTVVVSEPWTGFAPQTTAIPLMLGMNKDEGVLFAAGMAMSPTAKPSTLPTKDDYHALLDHAFHGSNDRIFTDPRYRADDSSATDYYSASGTALSHVIGDFSFLCGGEQTAHAGVSIPGAQTVYVYYFSQPPFFDLYPKSEDDGACAYTTGNVCHGNEMPYVFNALALMEARGFTPNTTDQPLATAMSADWVAFAKGQAPTGWLPYNFQTANANQLLGTAVTQINLDDTGHCPIWKSVPPFNHL